ncbi:arylamine N-acetyltransferase [Streptomyces sp. NPDC018610]|uniref:arylamine N-acetyltransferase n=1 Tax=Streptomyces sp. NPDC018610 TaxID=3365049 RepID=UPI0037AFB504
MDATEIDAYLRRIGAERPASPTGAALRELHVRHLRSVPFENLSIHLGEEIVLEEERLLAKVVGARRGGFCYELNGAFGALLAALGFDVTVLAARVHGEEGRLGIPYDHMALRVRTADGGDWLADVGFGAHSHFPLAFGERGEQADPGGTFTVTDVPVLVAPGTDVPVMDASATDVRGAAGTDAGLVAGPAVPVVDLDVSRDGRSQYRLETRPRVLGDFVGGAWWHRTSPASHFTRSLVCSRLTEDGGRITLSGRTLTTTGADGTRNVRELASDEEALAVYRDRFGIRLGCVPTVRNPEESD